MICHYTESRYADCRYAGCRGAHRRDVIRRNAFRRNVQQKSMKSIETSWQTNLILFKTRKLERGTFGWTPKLIFSKLFTNFLFRFLKFLFIKNIIDLRLCSRILNVPNKKNRCVILSNGNSHLINTIHPVYHITFPLCVYANVLIFVPMLSPSPQMLCLSLTLSLCLSVC